jgi:hypothetical protein
MKDVILNYLKTLWEELKKNQMVQRALHTFWQAAGAVLLFGAVDIFNLVTSGDLAGAWTALVALFIGAVAAGLAALRVFIKSSIIAYKNKEV